MKTFERYNPIVLAIYFIAVIGITVFSMNPVLLTVSLVGAVVFGVIKNKSQSMKSYLYLLVLFIVTAVINPIFNHNGKTVMFVINDKPFTLEALIYGTVAALMIISTVSWFRIFNLIMTSDKLMYVFGKFSPKLSLIISMGLRYIPLFSKQAKKISQSQTSLGLYKDDNIVDKVKGKCREFSVMTTWSLENGIITADSMSARGYGVKKRTSFAIFKFDKKDIVAICFTVLFFVFNCFCLALGQYEFEFYPTFSMSTVAAFGKIGYVMFSLLVFMPIFIEMEENIKWKFLKSKI